MMCLWLTADQLTDFNCSPWKTKTANSQSRPTFCVTVKTQCPNLLPFRVDLSRYTSTFIYLECGISGNVPSNCYTAGFKWRRFCEVSFEGYGGRWITKKLSWFWQEKAKSCKVPFRDGLQHTDLPPHAESIMLSGPELYMCRDAIR